MHHQAYFFLIFVFEINFKILGLEKKSWLHFFSVEIFWNQK